MVSWLSRKKYPDYWLKYSNHFKNQKKTDLQHIRFIVFDTETTGLNTKNDRILSIGAISIIGNMMDVADSLDIYVKQDKFNSKTVEIHGLLKEGNIQKIEEKEAVIQFLQYIKSSVIIAHHANFDITMINNALKRMQLPKLKNKFLDTSSLIKKTKFYDPFKKHYSLDSLCEIFHIDMHDRHTAAGDAYITGLIFLKILSALKKDKPNFTLDQLFFNSSRTGLL